MRIEIVTPAPLRSRTGNRVTALRWAQRLRELGHRVAVNESRTDARAEVLVALHAEKSADSVEHCARTSPATRIVVALTGTDVYGDLGAPAARRSLELAHRIVVLQPLATQRLPERLRARSRAILQSAPS